MHCKKPLKICVANTKTSTGSEALSCLQYIIMLLQWYTCTCTLYVRVCDYSNFLAYEKNNFSGNILLTVLSLISEQFFGTDYAFYSETFVSC